MRQASLVAHMIVINSPSQIHPDVYARDEHKWDYDTLTGGARQERFPATIHIPEGAHQPDVLLSTHRHCAALHGRFQGQIWQQRSSLGRG